jgi:hypothetical protein
MNDVVKDLLEARLSALDSEILWVRDSFERAKHAAHEADTKLGALHVQRKAIKDALGEPEPRVWDSIHLVPKGVKVVDKDGDTFWWEGISLMWGRGHGTSWGKVGSTFSANLSPFTEVVR